MIELQRILVPTDFSVHSQRALGYAVALAEKFDSALHLLHVIQDLALVIPEVISAVPPVPSAREEMSAAARAALERVVRENAIKRPVEQAVRQGSPFWEIIEYARENRIDLIVMGTHGHTGLAHVLLGSTTEKVVRKAPCPVLTVRHSEHDSHEPEA